MITGDRIENTRQVRPRGPGSIPEPDPTIHVEVLEVSPVCLPAGDTVSLDVSREQPPSMPSVEKQEEPPGFKGEEPDLFLFVSARDRPGISEVACGLFNSLAKILGLEKEIAAQCTALDLADDFPPRWDSALFVRTYGRYDMSWEKSKKFEEKLLQNARRIIIFNAPSDNKPSASLDSTYDRFRAHRFVQPQAPSLLDKTFPEHYIGSYHDVLAEMPQLFWDELKIVRISLIKDEYAKVFPDPNGPTHCYLDPKAPAKG